MKHTSYCFVKRQLFDHYYRCLWALEHGKRDVAQRILDMYRKVAQNIRQAMDSGVIYDEEDLNCFARAKWILLEVEEFIEWLDEALGPVAWD